APGTFWDGLPTATPDFMRPAGFSNKDHNFRNRILHPTKNNSLLGNSTSGRTGLGARLSWLVIDEGAKIEELSMIWGGLAATTQHRFTVSSADIRFGNDFMNIANQARSAQSDPSLFGPSLFRIPWNDNPLRDEQWFESAKAR